MRLCLLFIGVVMLAWSVGLAESATVNAASCSRTDVNTAITNATDGDTVQLPTCNVSDWATTITISKPLTIAGNGVTNTIIHAAAVARDYESNPMIRVNGVTGMVFRDFTMDGTEDTNPVNTSGWIDTAIFMSGSNIDFRIHHMKFTWFTMAIQVHGDPTVMRGVIDHNAFENNISHSVAGTPGNYGYSVSVVGNDVWPALALGTATNIFIEDNTFLGGKAAVVMNNGARAVTRWNTITNPYNNAVSINTHGKVASWAQGTRQFEWYNNTLNASGTGAWQGMQVTGGDGVIFNNSVSNYDGAHYELTNNPCDGTYPMDDQIYGPEGGVYLWNNQTNGAALTNSNLSHPCTLVQLNRDYFFTDKTTIGYVPYTYPHPLTVAATLTVSLTASPRYTLSGGTVAIQWPAITGATSCDSDMALGTDATWTGLSSATLQAGNASPGYTTTAVTSKRIYRLTCTDGVTPVVATIPVYVQTTANRVGYWPMNEGTGAPQDQSGLENHATLGGTTWTSTAQTGGQALAFDATSDFVLLPTPDMLPTAGSILFWARATNFPATLQYLFGETSIPAFGSTIQLYTSAVTGVLQLGLGNSHTVNTAVATLTLNQWTHYALTWNAGTYTIYLQGNPTAVATGSYTGLTAINSTMDLGQNGDTGRTINEGFTGQMDEVMLYTVALTGAEIQALAGATDLTPPAAPTNLRVVSP